MNRFAKVLLSAAVLGTGLSGAAVAPARGTRRGRKGRRRRGGRLRTGEGSAMLLEAQHPLSEADP